MHGKCVHRACKGWLSERGGSSGESVKVIGWLSEREELRESSGESVKVIGWLGPESRLNKFE